MSISLSVKAQLAEAATPLLDKLCEAQFATRLFAGDHTLWGSDAEIEASERLGWVNPFDIAPQLIREAIQLRDDLRRDGIDRIVLCGMGGSSLGPEVLAREAGVELHVLDTTHPAEIARTVLDQLHRTAVVVSSKSGSTVETISQAAVFRAEFERAGILPTQRMIYVTDPGSQLSSLEEQGYRVFLADASVGGRFSVLTAFGIVPAVLAGVDIERVIADAEQTRESLINDRADNVALRLASSLAARLPEKFIVLINESDDWGLSDWIEQLVAESTGKHGKGVLPISLPVDAPEFDNKPRNTMVLYLNDEEDELADISLTGSLGSLFYLWQVATAALGFLLELNPFDQPDVEAAKIAAREALGAPASDQAPSHFDPRRATDELVCQLREIVSADGYLAIQAFIDRESRSAQVVKELRTHLAKSLGVAVSLNWGPRYLHSVGQLHKGGRPVGAFLQLLDHQVHDYEIPDTNHSFSTLIQAQAQGDQQVLLASNRPVIVRSL